MPIKKLSESVMKKLKEHSKDHGGAKHMAAMVRLMQEPPYPSMRRAHAMLEKKKKPIKKMKPMNKQKVTKKPMAKKKMTTTNY